MDAKKSSSLNSRLKQLWTYLWVLLLAIAIIVLAFFWFVNRLRSTVYQTQLTNMNELADHDIITIKNFLDDEWKALQSTAAKASLRHSETEETIAQFLREEQVQSDFEDIYLIDSQHNAYNASGSFAVDKDVLESDYLEKSHVMSLRDVTEGASDTDHSYLFSAVQLSGVEVGGHEMIEMIGKLDLNKIQDRIRISNYSGQGYSSVFDRNGTMIIGINAAGQHLTNYYDYLENNTNLGVAGADRIKETATQADSFTETVVDKFTGLTYVVSFQSIEELDWYFIMSVPKSVFDEQNQSMLRLVMIMVTIVLVSLVLLLVFIFRSQLLIARQTEKEKQREALEEALDQAKIASRAKTTFLFNMSHDIRTPMNAVIGLSTLAKKHLNEPDKLKYYMEQIEIAGKQLLSIINNVLELSRIESDKVEIDEEVTDTKEIYDGLLAIFMNQSRAMKLHFNFKNEIKNRWLYMDRTHVEEVITNIVSNAMKYTEDGGSIDVSLSEKPGSDDVHTTLHVVVRDNGIGMSEEYQTKLFQQFERERTSTVSKIQGTGLGLSIVKKLIDMMNGTILVDSKQGVGTCMTVDIPLRIGTAPKLVETMSEEDIVFEGKHILLAEDIQINAMIAQEMLKSVGFVVDWVENGRACVDKLREAPEDYYELILMDIQMPVMDGYQATKEIRTMSDEKKANVPIIAMTANAFQEDKMNVLRAGMNAHIGKPVDLQQMLSTIKGALMAKNYQVDSHDLNAFRRQYEKLGCTCGYFIYDADEEGKITYADEITATLFGCATVEEFMEYSGGTFKGMVPPEDYERLLNTIKKQLRQSAKDIDMIDYHIIRKDGEIRQVKDIGYCAFNGERRQFYVYIADVTDVEKLYNDNAINVEQLLSENGLNFSEIARSDQGIYVADATRRIVYWNKGAEKFTGYKKAEMMGLNCFHTAMQHQNMAGNHMCSGLCPLMRSVLDGASCAEELSAVCVNGKRKILTVRTHPLYKDGEIFGAVEYFVELDK